MVKFNKRLWAALLAGVMAVGLFLSQSGGLVYAAEADDITEIDLTDLYTGAEVNHECEDYIKSAYNDEYHWQECSVCGKKSDMNKHDIVYLGENDCNIHVAKQSKYCVDGCGYSIDIEKPEHETLDWKNDASGNRHYKQCNVCKLWETWYPCKDSDGNLLGCTRSGTCVTCGHYYSGDNLHHGPISVHLQNQQAGEAHCEVCGAAVAYVRLNSQKIDNYKYHVEWSVNMYDQSLTLGTSAAYQIYGNIPVNTSNNIERKDGNTYFYSCDYEIPADAQATSADLQCVTSISSGNGLFLYDWVKIDVERPVIENVNVVGNGDINNFSKKAMVDVRLFDDWNSPVNMVYMRLLDSDKETELCGWGSCTRIGQNYRKSFDIVDEVIGEKTVYLQARDISNNVCEYPIKIAYLDSKSPQIISSREPNKEWSREKFITISCKDDGLGDVEIAFNDISRFEKAYYDGEMYIRSFKLTGDVYGHVSCAIYMRDGAGNISTEFIDIYNLDNTDPIVEKAQVKDAFDSSGSVIGWHVGVVANDTNGGINSDGAGVIGYAITERDIVPDESAYKTESTIFIPKSGTYYVWVKDAVGNVSSSQAISIMPDIYYDGISINNVEFNGKKIKTMYFNGRRLRL